MGGMTDQDTTDQGDWQHLLRKVKGRRRSIAAYLAATRPRAERLTTVTVVSSAMAAALTAGPALGRSTFTENVANVVPFFDESEDVWATLCAIAMVVAIIAAASANLRASRNSQAKIVRAEACEAELEGLQSMVEFRQVPLAEGVKLYQQYVSKVAFIPEDPSTRENAD